jgi:Pyruvate/2-oxoacid:ferredoxin oxidoreductase delta subunit
MMIDPEVCTGCGSCMVFCPVEAIVETDRKTPKRKAIRAVDLARCVECGNCLRADVCPVDAIVQQPLDWPRSLRSAFSNPMTEHKSKDMGRGTEEMKTNEITHRIGKGEVGVAIELGRPLLGSSFRDVERVTRAMAGVGVTFEPHNPLTSLIEDLSTGTLRKDVLDERVLSTIVEFKIQEERLDDVLPAIRDVAGRIESVFSLGIIAVLPPGGQPPVLERIKKLGFDVRPNGKVNLGLGRPIPGDSPPGPGKETSRSGRRVS